MLSYDSPIAAKGQDVSSSVPVTASLSTTKPGPSQQSTVAQMSSIASSTAKDSPSQFNHIWLVTGPAGCGKTTVAEHIAEVHGMPYIEGDAVSYLPRVQCLNKSDYSPLPTVSHGS